ncbi:hypothetical protein RJ639_044550 [Escallonia herrerae]|uniref:Ycf20-like protein n=1 Tax=Escallonia herrerae TaxID=1293975 RepID=A0AA89B316_9ASTE|nr:hypothetical protein RJ639_044550 [Escallonia herrerae]
MKFMACKMRAIMLQTFLSTTEIERSETTWVILKNSFKVNTWNSKPCTNGPTSEYGAKSAPYPRRHSLVQPDLVMDKSYYGYLIICFYFCALNSLQARRHGWKIAFALDTDGSPSNGGQDSVSSDSPGLGQTRLGRLVSAGGRQLLEKLNSSRKNFPMKIFLLLLGFYTANALATILGQTGDWDVLVAGVVVAAIEGIGMLMYRKPSSLPTGRLQSLVVMINYWKAGVCLGLFVDAFKLGS